METYKIHSRTLADGSVNSTYAFRFEGTRKDVKSTYIQSGIHGAEVQGYLVSLKLIEYFKKNKPNGNVTIVPIANPYGLNCKIGEHTLGRFDLTTGRNWNRNYINNSTVAKKILRENKNLEYHHLIKLFKEEIKKNLKKKINKLNNDDYAKKLAIDLQIASSDADIVLDLHCDTISKPHIYSPNYALESAIEFDISFIIEIPNKFKNALDEAIFYPWLSLMNSYNKLYPKSKVYHPYIESFTIELGNREQINPQMADIQYKNILRYLSKNDICQKIENNNNKNKIISCKLKDFIIINAPTGGLIIDSVELGQKINARNKIMTLSMPSDISKNSSKTTDIIYKYDSIPITKTCTPIVHEGMIIAKLMTKFKYL